MTLNLEAIFRSLLSNNYRNIIIIKNYGKIDKIERLIRNFNLPNLEVTVDRLLNVF